MKLDCECPANIVLSVAMILIAVKIEFVTYISDDFFRKDELSAQILDMLLDGAMLLQITEIVHNSHETK